MAKTKTPFPSTFWGAILVLVVSGVIVTWAAPYLQRQPPADAARVAPRPVPSGTGRDQSNIAPSRSPGPPLATRTTTPVAAESGAAVSVPSGLSKKDDLATIQRRHDPRALNDLADQPELIRLSHGEALSVRTFRGTASVSFDHVAGVAFATLMLSPIKGPVLREPIYAEGGSLAVLADSKRYAARVIAVDFSRRTLTLQLSLE